MVYGILLAALILDGVFLGVVVLLQSGKGGGLAAMGGGAAATDGILGGRQATTMLTRATWTSGSLFMTLSLILSIMSSVAQQPESILRQDGSAATTTVPAGERILDLLDQSGDASDAAAEPTEPPADGDGND